MLSVHVCDVFTSNRNFIIIVLVVLKICLGL